MDSTGLIIAAAAVFGLIGWLLGRGAGRARSAKTLQVLAADLGRGRRPEVDASSPQPLRDIRSALDREWTGRNEEREQALREALGRIAAFLREEVRDPLQATLRGDTSELRAGIERALGSLQDMEFFLREPLTPDEVHDLVQVVRQVTSEFTQDWEIAVRLTAGGPVRAHIHRASFMDAVYLLLHNAGQFGGGKTIDVVVEGDADRATVRIRDQGAGFTSEALERAHDLFFTTTEGNLGLGIPFARKIIESFGGDIDLRNLGAEGGAEVSLSLPSA